MNLTPQEMPINTRNQMLLTTNTFLSHVEDRVCRAELSLTVCHSSHCDERSAASVLHFCHSRFKQQFSSNKLNDTGYKSQKKLSVQSKILCTSSVLCSRIIIIFTHQCFIVSKRRINGNQQMLQTKVEKKKNNQQLKTCFSGEVMMSLSGLLFSEPLDTICCFFPSQCRSADERERVELKCLRPDSTSHCR